MIKYIVALIIIAILIVTTGSSLAETKEEPTFIIGEPLSSSMLPYEEVHVEIVEIEEPKVPRTSLPIYEVYKDGVQLDVPVEWQWYIRSLAAQHNINEKLIFGLIIAESGFNPNCLSDKERSFGLGQINKHWIRTKYLPRFDETENYRERNLFDPYDNILTIFELWCYARDTYNLDLSYEPHIKKLLYWYNTGNDPSRVTKWAYSDKVIKYANELKTIEK